MKLNKKIKIIVNYVLGPLLFLWLSYSLFRQVKKQPDLPQAWDAIKQTPLNKVIFCTGSVLVLMLLNWLIETKKWQLVIQKIQTISLLKAFKAVLSGVSFSATTPNRMGEYAGRVLFLDEGNRLRSVALTIVGSMSQLIITLFMGCIGLGVMRNDISGNTVLTTDNSLWIKIFLYGSLAALLVLLLIYFRLSVFIRLAEKISWFNKNLYLVKDLENIDRKLLLKLLSLSCARFIIFCLQYFLLFRLFQVEISWWQCFFVLSVIFLILAVIPTFAIADLGIRGNITWRLMQLFTVNTLGVTLATAGIWFINLVLPAIAGSLLIASVKLFKKREMED
jgi:MFS family permease